MTRRCLTGWVASVLALVGVLGPGVAEGAAPTFERIVIDETFADDFLTEECGVEVTSHIQGKILARTFSGEGTGVSQVNTVNVAVTATAGDRVFRFRDVGADVTRIEPDGTAVLSIIGQVPFQFAGVLKIDLATGDAIFEPRDRSEEQLARACAALTGG
jgi:xanthosine utilization system XapX-like protein